MYMSLIPSLTCRVDDCVTDVAGLMVGNLDISRNVTNNQAATTIKEC